MLRFKILNGYHAGDKAGHAVVDYDTTLAEDIKAAEKEFDRLLKQGRTALNADGERLNSLPTSGDVIFLLPMQGG